MGRPDVSPPPFGESPAPARRTRRASALAALGLALGLAGLALTVPAPLSAADGDPADIGPAAEGRKVPQVAVPAFWNKQRRLERPDATLLPSTLRFVTTGDYPPFNFNGADGQLAGFNVDLARAICAELRVACTIQTAPFDRIADEISEGRYDAGIAGIASSPLARSKLDFTERYLGTPARFVALRAQEGPGKESPGKDGPNKGQPALADATPETVAARKIGVVSRTAHEAYLRTFFSEAGIRPYSDLKGAQDALKRGEVDLVFADGISLALWLNGTDSAGCCAFVGGPFTESRFFGDGLAIAIKPGNAALRDALDFALQKVWEQGVFTDLYLRWFPVSFY